jgi:hypothetical protein
MTTTTRTRAIQHSVAIAFITLVLAIVIYTPLAHGAPQKSSFVKERQQRRTFGNDFLALILKDKKDPSDQGMIPNAPVYALAGLYTGKDVKGANKILKKAMTFAAGKDKKISPEEAIQAKWTMRGWLRVYYLFYDKSSHFPGRMSKDTQSMMEEMFFQYGVHKSKLKRTNLKNIWHIHGSENHDMMDFSNAYLALQSVENLPKYKNQKLPDGHTPKEHVQAWHTYFRLYALERAKNGLFVEISPTYGKWFVGEFVNMYEFSKDPTVRKRMEMLLHLMWTDWSIDHLNGVRGGGKTRCYQGSYSQTGKGDSWDKMAWDLFGQAPYHWNSHGGLSTLDLATSQYELPDITFDIALRKGDFSPYAFQSLRPSKVKGGSGKTYYDMDEKGGGILRYSYCTPEAIMGSWMLDTRENYAAINTQNRWQGVIFPTGVDRRVFPQSRGLKNGKTYSQHLAVQYRNVMLVTNHPKAKQTGELRVFFPKAIQQKVTEEKGWIIVHEGESWLGVRFLDQAGATAKNYTFESTDLKMKVKETSRKNEPGSWMLPKEKSATMAMVLSREKDHKTLKEFIAYLESHSHEADKGGGSYSYVDDLGENIKLDLGRKLNIPTINGKPVDLYPQKVFDSPYMSSDHRSGVVTLKKGKEEMILDFNK